VRAPPRSSPVSARTAQLAQEREDRIIAALVGPRAVISEDEFAIIVRRIRIPKADAEALRRAIGANNQGMEAEICKDILMQAARPSGGNALVARLRPIVHGGIMNLRDERVNWCPPRRPF
jgi:hypothetical protein